MTTTNMHRKDFKPCAICHKGVMHTGLPLFWRVHIERIGVDMQAAQRQQGLEQFFGGTSPGAAWGADWGVVGEAAGAPGLAGAT